MAIDVVLTKHIQNSIREAISNERIPHDLANQLSEYTEKCLGKKESDSVEDKVAIPFKLLKRLWECLRETERDFSSKLYLHELLTGSEVYVHPLRLPEKCGLDEKEINAYQANVMQSPELLARLKKLKDEQDKAKYDSMVANVDKKWNQSDGMQLGHEVRSSSKQLASIINFLLSIVAAFAFGFIATQYAFSSESVRVILGVLMAFTVAIAELYFMARVEI